MDEGIKKIKLLLKGLSCANCANKIEGKVNNIKGVKEAFVNFATSTLTIEVLEGYKKEDLIEEIKDIVKSIEKGVSVEEIKGSLKRPTKTISKCEDGACIINDNNYVNTEIINNSSKILLKGLTCANCANKIENKIRKLDSIKNATINFATTTLIVELNQGNEIDEVFKEISKIVKSLEPDV